MHKYLMELLGPNLLSLFVSVCIGLIAGIEREIDSPSEYKHFTGIRTMPLVAALGCITTFIAKETSVIVIVAAIVSFLFFAAVVFYVRSHSSASDIKYELMLMVVFMLGLATGLHLIRETLVTTIIMVAILSLKEKFRYVTDRLTKQELLAFVKFAVIAVVVIPFIPDKKYGPDGIINPNDVALVAILVSSLSFIGYFLTKFGKPEKSILLTAALGGLFSSTAVTWLYSLKSRENEAASHLYSCGILIANTVMFCRILFFTFLFNRSVFFVLAIPNVLMILILLSIVFFVLKKNGNSKYLQEINLGNPVNLNNAIGFAVMYVAIVFIVYYGNKYLGSTGLYLSGVISGFSDVDAITINMSKLAGNAVKVHTSTIVIILAMISNGIVKLGVSLFNGDKKMKKLVGYSLGTVIIFGTITSIIIGQFHK